MTFFCHFTKKVSSLWVFMLQVWFTYQNEAKGLGRNRSAPLFRNLVLFFFYKPSNKTKVKFLFLAFSQKIADCRSILQENYTENEKSRLERLFLIFSPMFWYANHLCSIKTDWVEAISINLHPKKNEIGEKLLQSLEIENVCFFLIFHPILLKIAHNM